MQILSAWAESQLNEGEVRFCWGTLPEQCRAATAEVGSLGVQTSCGV